MEILGKDYCLLQAKFEFDGFLYQSEPLITQKKTGIVKSEDIDLDYLGNPVKNRTFDPSQLIDASSGTIMPIFQKATFVHNNALAGLEKEEKMLLKIRLYLNDQVVAMHDLDLDIFLRTVSKDRKNSEWD